MRLNKYVAQVSGLSRRAVDAAITTGRISVNGSIAQLGQQITTSDAVTLDGTLLAASEYATVILNKPTGYVCSRDGQGSKTIYDLLPSELQHLKSVGRLDKDSSGLLLLTNDGNLAHKLTHPSFGKQKAYLVTLDKSLSPTSMTQLKNGVTLDDGVSNLEVRKSTASDGEVPNIERPVSDVYCITMTEGRNRQIRRTFEALGYTVVKLHRTKFGPYTLEGIPPGSYKQLAAYEAASRL